VLALFWPGRDDHGGCRVARRIGGQSEDLTAIEAVACPQRCSPGTQQGIDEVFPVLVGGIAGRRWLSGQFVGDRMGRKQ
jgi:hypothetical protein